jgi:hypothetical protein
MTNANGSQKRAFGGFFPREIPALNAIGSTSCVKVAEAANDNAVCVTSRTEQHNSLSLLKCRPISQTNP